MGRVDYLDGWRGLAILLVLLAHFVGVPFLDAGRLGVDLFFVLSGLLMSRILYEKRVPLAVFYQRRISRILPVFLLYLAVVFSVAAIAGTGVSAKEVVSSVLFLRTYVEPHIWYSGLPIGHVWSLNVEEHCYVVLATIAGVSIFRRREGLVVIGLGLASYLAIVVYHFMEVRPEAWMLRTEAAAACLLFAAGYRTIAHRVTVPSWAPVAALAAGSACYLDVLPWSAQAGVAPVLLAFAVNHIGQAPNFVLAALRAKALHFLGLWSYSIYLWQQPFYVYQDAVPLAVVWTVLCGIVSFYLFEQPVRNWLNERTMFGRAAPAGAAV